MDQYDTKSYRPLDYGYDIGDSEVINGTCSVLGGLTDLNAVPGAVRDALAVHVYTQRMSTLR